MRPWTVANGSALDPTGYAGAGHDNALQVLDQFNIDHEVLTVSDIADLELDGMRSSFTDLVPLEVVNCEVVVDVDGLRVVVDVFVLVVDIFAVVVGVVVILLISTSGKGSGCG